jgi:signal transduction histidine kinase
VDISDLLEKILLNYQRHYDEFPSLTQSIEPAVHITANRPLVESLFSNLIKNAVVHNIPGGTIRLHLDNTKFILENTGPAIAGEPERLFERFKKGSDESKTTGLGLALVKQIAQLYHLGLQYHYENTLHRITVTFSTP